MAVTNADGFTTSSQYNFDHGAVTRITTPSPNSGQTAPYQTFSYDSAARLTQVTRSVDGSFQRWVYQTNMLNVNIGYDAAGNRDWMDDGPDFVDYSYDQLSRLTSETRTFDGVPGSYTLSYLYNMGDEVKRVTNQSGVIVNYNHDDIGRVSSVTGSGYAGVSNYLNSLSYRAFGAAKQITHGNGKVLSLSYNNRMMLTQWNPRGAGLLLSLR